jgi:hypothetical protein
MSLMKRKETRGATAPTDLAGTGSRLDLSHVRGCLLGGAVGDALGADIEFDDLPRIRRQFGPAGLADYATAYGREGAITDDTQMTLFTAEGLIRALHRWEGRGSRPRPRLSTAPICGGSTRRAEPPPLHVSRMWSSWSPPAPLVWGRGEPQVGIARSYPPRA